MLTSQPKTIVRQPRRWPVWFLLFCGVGGGVRLLVGRPAPNDIWIRRGGLEPGRYEVREVRSAERLLLMPRLEREADQLPAAPVEVRLLGIEVAKSSEAAARKFVERLLLGGQQVRVRLDRRRLDPDGSLLAYVFCHLPHHAADPGQAGHSPSDAAQAYRPLAGMEKINRQATLPVGASSRKRGGGAEGTATEILLNSELVLRGWAADATHPADASEMRRAIQWAAGAAAKASQPSDSEMAN